MSETSNRVRLVDFEHPMRRYTLNLFSGEYAVSEMPSVDAASAGASGFAALRTFGFLDRQRVMCALILDKTGWLVWVGGSSCRLRSRDQAKRVTLAPFWKEFVFTDDSGHTHRYRYLWTDLMEDGMAERDFLLYVSRIAASDRRQHALTEYWRGRKDA